MSKDREFKSCEHTHIDHRLHSATLHHFITIGIYQVQQKLAFENNIYTSNSYKLNACHLHPPIAAIVSTPSDQVKRRFPKAGFAVHCRCCKMTALRAFVDAMTQPQQTPASTQTCLSYHVSSLFKILSERLHQNHMKRC